MVFSWFSHGFSHGFPIKHGDFPSEFRMNHPKRFSHPRGGQNHQEPHRDHLIFGDSQHLADGWLPGLVNVTQNDGKSPCFMGKSSFYSWETHHLSWETHHFIAGKIHELNGI